MNRNQICSYFSDGTQTVYEYSPSGNLLHVTGETGTISYSYNKAGQKTKVESDSRTLVYSYGKNAEVKALINFLKNSRFFLMQF